MNTARSTVVGFLLAACGGEEVPAGIADFDARSPVVRCERAIAPDPPLASASVIQAVDDSTFLVVDALAREVVVLDGALERRRTVSVPEHGPGSAAELTGAALSGDSLLVVLDAGRQRLVGLTPTGHELWTMPTVFPAQRVAFAGPRLLVAAFGMDPRVSSLVHELEGRGFRSLDVPIEPNPDALSRMFMNGVTIVGHADGSAFVMHELVVARAWRLDRTGSPQRRAVPVSDGVVASLGRLPPMPLREEDLEHVAAPVLGAAPTGDGGVVYLTRSGGRSGAHTTKALVRADRELTYQASNRLDVNAVGLAHLGADPAAVLVVDPDLNWYRCPIP